MSTISPGTPFLTIKTIPSSVLAILCPFDPKSKILTERNILFFDIQQI